MKQPTEIESFILPIDAAERKKFPIYTGCIAYFKDAIACVARRSWEGNNQHHPDEPLHWDKSKSADELDADLRHKMENEPDAAAWRALAHLQRQLEAGWRPSWYNPEHYIDHKSLGRQAIDVHSDVESMEAWLRGEGLSLFSGTIVDAATGETLSPEDEEQVRKEYDEYVQANQTQEPTEIDEVLSFDKWQERNWVFIRTLSDEGRKEVYQLCTNKQRNASNGTEANQ